MDVRDSIPPAARYADLRAAGRVDLDGFLRAVGPLTPADAAGVFRVDLGLRWQAGDRAPVEEYVARLPAPDPEAEVDLVFAEYLLRERLGETPDPDEYARRFPAHAAVLRDQIALHRALATAPVTLAAEGAEATASGASPAAGSPVPLPREFGRYVLHRILGAGGMGVVYLADDSRLGRQVALKVLRPDAGDEAAAGRFEREARLAATLAHPNLCPVYDFGRTDGVDYLTMPFIPGESLAARVRREGPFPPAEAVRLVRLIAGAMQAAHDGGVIHRDLKPGNVILNEKGDPVVTDFGLARRVAGDDPRLTGSGAVLGTPTYMPPEQIGSAPEAVGPASDVYSLGAILYELLTGRPPYTGLSGGEVLRQVLTADPPRPSRVRPGLDRRLEAVCRRAMAKDPAKRFRSMAEFAAALADPRFGRRRRWWVAGGVAALVATVVVVWSGCPGQPTPPTGSQGDPPPVVPNDPPPPPPAPQPEDPLPVGSRWTGTFKFRGKDGHTGTAELTVTGRKDETFRGTYSTEGKKFAWNVEGTIRGGKVRWAVREPLTEAARKTRSKAELSGTCTDREMTLDYHDAQDQSRADMTLTRR